MNDLDISNIELLIHKDYYDDFIHIEWRITYLCNYDCSYCIQKGSRSKKIIPLDVDFLKKIAVKINSIIDSVSKPCYLTLVGGEPTLIDIPYFLENIFISKNLKYIKIISNFSKNVEFYNKINEISVKRNIIDKFNFSLHEKFVEPEKFFEKLKQLTFSNFLIELVVTKDNIEIAKKVKDLAEKNNFTLKFDINKKDVNFDFTKEFINSAYSKYFFIKYRDNTELKKIDSNIVRYYRKEFKNVYCNSKIIFIDQKGFINFFNCKKYSFNLLTFPESLYSTIFNTKRIKCENVTCSLCGAMELEF